MMPNHTLQFWYFQSSLYHITKEKHNMKCWSHTQAEFHTYYVIPWGDIQNMNNQHGMALAIPPEQGYIGPVLCSPLKFQEVGQGEVYVISGRAIKRSKRALERQKTINCSISIPNGTVTLSMYHIHIQRSKVRL